MFAAQDGGCYLCGSAMRFGGTPDDPRKACVDHDGPSREPCGWKDVRALLCFRCNVSLPTALTGGFINARGKRYLASRPHRKLIKAMLRENRLPFYDDED